jgi:hypothetical protein
MAPSYHPLKWVKSVTPGMVDRWFEARVQVRILTPWNDQIDEGSGQTS